MTTHKERPILFSGPMVLALLAGRKTVTRRLVKPQPAPNSPHDGGTVWEYDGDNGLHIPYGTVGHLTVAEKTGLRCPYGQPGDRLWVKETWAPVDFLEAGHVREEPVCIGYRADLAALSHESENVHTLDTHAWNWDLVKWKSPLFMPRWASRLTLEVVSVRVERLHDITEEDAKAEGVERWVVGEGWQEYGLSEEELLTQGPPLATARESFASLWHSINGAESWDANPWVWRVEFKRVDAKEVA